MPGVLLVSYSDLEGRRFNGFDLLENPPDGWSFRMAVASRRSDNPAVSLLPPAVPGAGVKALRRLDRALGLDGFLGVSGRRLVETEAFREADIVHLHLVHIGPFFGLPALPLMSRSKPLVWTIHDSWPVTGMCIHPLECGAWRDGCTRICPHPRGGSPLGRLTPAALWRLKRRIYEASRLTLVTASGWMDGRVAASPLLGRFPRRIIPFGADLAVFRPGRRQECRDRLGIPRERPVLFVRGAPLRGDVLKGMAFLGEALARLDLPARATLLVAGSDPGFELPPGRFDRISLGWIDDPGAMSDALSAADLLLMPSMQESFGMTAVEAMACGTVPVVIPGTALPEITGAPGVGAMPESASSGDFALLVASLLADRSALDGRGDACAARARSLYDFRTYAGRHAELYGSLLGETAR